MKIKRVVALTAVWLAVAVTLASGGYQEFCAGWNDGYIDGYCGGRVVGCVRPIVPCCPVPSTGEDTYQDGYARGFAAGHRH